MLVGEVLVGAERAQVLARRVEDDDRVGRVPPVENEDLAVRVGGHRRHAAEGPPFGHRVRLLAEADRDAVLHQAALVWIPAGAALLVDDLAGGVGAVDVDARRRLGHALGVLLRRGRRECEHGGESHQRHDAHELLDGHATSIMPMPRESTASRGAVNGANSLASRAPALAARL